MRVDLLWGLVCVSLCGLCVSAHASVSAQGVTPETRTSVTGAVFDPQNYAITGAEVIVEAALSGQRWQITTDRLGGWELRLPSGRYTLRIAAEGFEPHAELLVVPPDGFVIHGVTLTVAPVREPPVEVAPSVRPSLVRLPNGSFGRRFDPREFLETPAVNGLTLQSAWNRTPGVVATEQTGTTFQISTHGLRRDENGVWIDQSPLVIGTDPTGFAHGLGLIDRMLPWAHDGSTKTILPFPAVEKINVMTANVPPQFRRSAGAQTQIVTKAGTDQFKGSAFGDRRMDGWSADDYFLKDRQIDVWNGGAGLGGPIVRSRLNFYVAGESQRLWRPVPLHAIVPSDAARASASPSIRPIFDAYPRPNGPDVGNGEAEYRATIPAGSDLDVVSGRFDVTLSPQQRLTSRVTYGRSRGDEVDPLRLEPRSFYALIGTTRTTYATFGLTSVLSPRVVHEFTGMVGRHQTTVRSDTAGHGGAQPLPLDVLFGLPANTWGSVALTLGGGPGIVNRGVEGNATQSQFYVKSATTVQRGAHLLTLGGDVRQGRSASDRANQWINMKLGTVTQTLQQGGALLTVERVEDTSVVQRALAAYVRDEWRMSSRLTIWSDVRWDVRPAPRSQTAVQPFLLDTTRLDEGLYARDVEALWRTTYHNFSPQVSAAWKLNEHAEIHGGAGLTWGDLTAPGALPYRTYPYGVTGFLKGVLPLSSEKVTLPPSTPEMAREFVILDEALRRPRIGHWNAGLDYRLGRAQVYATYVGNIAHGLPYAYRQYVGEFGQYQAHGFTPDGRSDYHALHLGGRFVSAPMSVEVSYSQSRARDNQSGEGSRYRFGAPPPPDLVDPESYWGAADFSRPHMLDIVASCRLPAPHGPKFIQHLFGNWQVNATGRVQSGPAFTVIVGRNLGAAAFEYRPDIVPGVPTWISDPRAPNGRRLNHEAFRVPHELQQGTHERNSLRGYPVGQLDMALVKTVRAGSVTAKLRLQAHNVLNTLNWGPPHGRLTTAGADTFPRFGEPFQTYATALGSGTLLNGGLASVRQFGGPRSLHAILEVEF